MNIYLKNTLITLAFFAVFIIGSVIYLTFPGRTLAEAAHYGEIIGCLQHIIIWNVVPIKIAQRIYNFIVSAVSPHEHC